MQVLVDLRKLDLADRLGKDLITVESLLEELENALDKVDEYKEKLKELNQPVEPDDYDIWNDNKMMYEEI